MEQEMPEVPNRFIENQTVGKMKNGQIAYISPIHLTLTTDRKMWLYPDIEYDEIVEKKEDEENMVEKEDRVLLFIQFKKIIKIQRVEKGFKLFIYEFFDFLRDKRFACSEFKNCEAGALKKCDCKRDLRSNLFNMKQLHEENGTPLPVIAFDEPKDNINDPNYLNSLTAESVALLTIETVRILLVNATDDENYLAAALLRDELRKRT